MKAMDPKSTTPPPPRRRRTRSSFSSSISSVSSSSSSSSIRSTPSPSHYFVQTPFHSSASSIPFSWEQTPGIPKNPSKTPKPRPNPHLPLPPPLRSDSFTRGGGKKKLAADEKIADVDPFAAALAECAKDRPPEESDPWIGSRPVSAVKSGRRFSIGDRLGLGLGLLDLYGSCKTSCPVAESTIEIPRVGPYRVLNRRVE